MSKFKLYSNIVPKQALRHVQSETLNAICNALAKTFGPNGRFTAYRREKDIARYTKDGHTVLKNIMFNGPIEFTMKDNLEDITRRIVTTVGDGTTSAIILSTLIFEQLRIGNEVFGISEKELVSQLQEIIDEAIKIIDNNKREATPDDIYKIAMISTDNNEYIASLLKDIYSEYGMEVFIDVTSSKGTQTFTKEYDGFTINSGLADIAFINDTAKHCSSLKSPKLYLFEDPIDTVEMSLFMEKIIHDNVLSHLQGQTPDLENIVPTVIVCPKIGKDINTTMDQLIQYMSKFPPEKRNIIPINIVTNINDLNYIMDLSYISGAKIIKKYIDPNMQKADQERGIAPTMDTIHEFAGSCDEVISDATKTKFINPALMHNSDGSLSDIYNNRLIDMEQQLKGLQETSGSTTEIGLLKKRINSYKANQVEIYVGGISETDRDSLRDLVEDAVLNCRSAALEGYGFGANYEGFSAIHTLLQKHENELGLSPDSQELQDVISGRKFDLLYSICRAYMNLYSILYADVNLEEYENTDLLVLASLKERCPFNIRTNKFDGLVLSSIKSDQIILDAIGKIIGTVFLTNQFLVEGVAFNKYMDIEIEDPVVINEAVETETNM